MKGLLRNISKLITVLSAVFVFICGFCNYKISAAEYDATYDPAPVEGYHKVKNGNEYYCDHNFEPDKYSESAWVYSDCEIFNPTEQEPVKQCTCCKQDYRQENRSRKPGNKGIQCQ